MTIDGGSAPTPADVVPNGRSARGLLHRVRQFNGQHAHSDAIAIDNDNFRRQIVKAR